MNLLSEWYYFRQFRFVVAAMPIRSSHTTERRIEWSKIRRGGEESENDWSRRYRRLEFSQKKADEIKPMRIEVEGWEPKILAARWESRRVADGPPKENLKNGRIKY